MGDVSVHYNFPNKRHRREAEEEDDADEEVIDEALIVALEYAEWYDKDYIPWYESQEHMLEDLQNLSQMKQDHDEALSHLENYSMVMQQLLQEYMRSIN